MSDPDRRPGRSLDAVNTAFDMFGAALSPGPLALPAGFVAAVVANNSFDVKTIGWLLVAFSTGYAVGAVLQVLGAWGFHRLFDRSRRRKRP